jgi:S1-C subfamily serine protease
MRRKMANRLRSLIVTLVATALVLQACKRTGSVEPSARSATAAAPVLLPATPPPVEPIAPLSSSALIEDERNTIGVFRETAASAVFVTQKQVVLDYWAGQAVEVPAGSGSGFVWDEQGHIVTNFHVVQNARRLVVTLQDQSAHEAVVRGVEPRKDIAVLKIDVPKTKLLPIRQRDPKQLRLEVGQKAIAIGNPFGLDHTLTVGVISALGRSVDGVGGVTIRDMVQTDAAINPGNSGGPLLDSAGRLIGMNTVIFSKSGSSAGVGFAVPASTIQRVVPQIIRTGRAEELGIGIRIDVERRFERRAGVRGVVVLSVEPGGPAEKAGVKGLARTPLGLTLGDVIVGIDQTRVDDYDDLYNAFDSHQSGDRVKLKLRRGDQVVEVETELVTLK